MDKPGYMRQKEKENIYMRQHMLFIYIAVCGLVCVDLPKSFAVAQSP